MTQSSTSYLQPFEKPFTVGHTLNHRLLANVDARCAPCASMCLIMTCLMFRASMPTTMRFCTFFTTYLAQPRNVRLIPVESIAVGFIMATRVIRHKWMPQFLRGARVQRSGFVNNYRAVRSRAHRNDDTSNKKKVSSPRREHHREKLETYHILTTQLPLTNSEPSGQNLEDKKKTPSVPDGSEHVKSLYPKTTSKPRTNKKQAKHQRFMCSSLTWNGIFIKLIISSTTKTFSASQRGVPYSMVGKNDST